MDNRDPIKAPELMQFNHEVYFTTGIDSRSKDKLPKITLNNDGIRLVAQYYSTKYKMKEDLVITKDASELVEILNSDEFKLIRATEGDIRVPFIVGSLVEVGRNQVSNRHSTPAVYIKEGDQEAILVFDSIGCGAYLTVAVGTEYEVYTVDAQRQRDFYSCHTDALVFLRELTGKDENGNFLIPNLLARLKSENRVVQSEVADNVYDVSMIFDRLRITTQSSDFIKKPNIVNEVIHVHKGHAETLEMFLKRYPPDEPDSSKDKYVSSYLREKGLKYSHLIEMQFYLNQIKDVLGTHFSDQIRDDFISAAKSMPKQYRQPGFFAEHQASNLHVLSQKFLEENLKLINLNEMRSSLDASIRKAF